MSPTRAHRPRVTARTPGSDPTIAATPSRAFAITLVGSLFLAAPVAAVTYDHPLLGTVSDVGTIQGTFDSYKGMNEGAHHYKAFALSPRGASGYARGLSVQQAIRNAVARCESGTTVSASACRLFAVGDTIVVDMDDARRAEVYAAYEATKFKLGDEEILANVPEDAPLGESGVDGLKRYGRLLDSTRDKVFVLSSRGWAFQIADTFDEAHEKANAQCKQYLPNYKRGRGCPIFAVGNTIVWDMSDEQVEKVIAEYKARR